MSPNGLYRGFSQSDLDQEYSPSSMVASIEPFLTRYASQSAGVRSGHDPKRWSSHAYGPRPEQALDLFLPAGAPAALLVFIHGGYWQALAKEDASFPAAALTGAGFAYAAVNYTLAPHAGMDEIVEENRQALRFLWRERARLGLGEGGMVVSGHSAGAHLAAMMLTTNWSPGPEAVRLKGALLLGGIYDLEPIRQSYVNEPLRLDEAAARRNSPLFQAPATACPVVIGWAEHDTAEFKRQSRALAEAWQAQGAAITQFEQPGVNHFDSLFDWDEAGSRLTRETLALLRL